MIAGKKAAPIARNAIYASHLNIEIVASKQAFQ
jgi:hypothetical protein